MSDSANDQGELDPEDWSAESLNEDQLFERGMDAARQGNPWRLKECLEAGVALARRETSEAAEGLLEAAARSNSIACLEMVQRALRQTGLASCSAQALANARRGFSDRALEKTEALLSGNALDPSPLPWESLGLSEQLESAIASGDVKMLAAWAKRGLAGVRVRRSMTPLGLAAARGESDCLMALLRHGADPSEVDEMGWTALVWAAADSPRCLRALLPLSNAKFADARGMTALMCAAVMMSDHRYGNPECLKELLPHSDPLAEDKEGRTALMLAVKHGVDDCADELRAFGGPLALPEDEEEAIAAMAKKGRGDWVALLERSRLARQLPGRDPGKGAKPRL